MNWKALVMLCLVFFAATTVIGIALTSLIPLPKTTSIAEKSALFDSPLEPLGDPVDNKHVPS